MIPALTILCLFLLSGSVIGQTNPAPRQSSYEVATVKPWDGKGFGLLLRTYILEAFGLQVSATDQLIGPDWVNRRKYVIEGKPSDATRDAMKEMTPEDRREQIHLMERSLLVDRFALRAHFETRVRSIYRLVIARGGSKLKNSDTSKVQISIGSNGQVSQIRGTAITIRNFLNILINDPQINGRTVIDDTGLTGTYDIQLNWAALTAPDSESGVARSQGPEGTSLFTAIEEQLGLKLVPAKAPAEVLIIDHIELPSEN